MIKKVSFNRFWKNSNDAAMSNKLPLRIMLELTYRCNFKCKHCYIPESYRKKSTEKELKTREVFSILDQIADMGCMYLGISGGEPFLRKDILNIISYAKMKGFIIVIYTNGSLITENIARALKVTKPYKLDITLPGMSKSVFEWITGVPGSRARVFNAIGSLSKKKLRVAFKSCVLKQNISEIKDIYNFTASLKAQYRIDGFISPCIDGSSGNHKYRVSVNEISFLDSSLLKNTDCKLSHTQYRDKSHLFSCGAGFSRATINPYGQLRICTFIDYPRYGILNSSFREKWHKLNKLMNEIGRKNNNFKCIDCELKSRCTWCPAQSWIRNSTFSPCIDEFKQLAKYRILSAN